LWTSSGHSLWTTSRISSEIAPMCSTSSMGAFDRPASSPWCRRCGADRCGAFWSFPPPALYECHHDGLARRSWRAKGQSRRDIPARLEPVINTPERNS
jgi:hypothetical protein